MGIIDGDGILGITKKGIEDLINQVAGEVAGALNPSTITVNSESEMLASSAKIGDTALRTDIHEVFRLSALPASTLANWKSTLAEEGIEKVAEFTPTLNQTSFDLGEIPLKQNLTKMFVNGLKQDYGIDFTVNNNLISYLNTSIELDPSDQVEIVYYI